jgi:hypothetical protein
VAHQVVAGGDLEEVVPQGVDVVDGEHPAQPPDGVGVPALRIRVAVRAVDEGGVPRRQVDEADLGPGAPTLGEGDPLGRMGAERAPRGVVAGLVAVAGEDGDGQVVVEQHLVHAAVHVRRPLDEDVRRPQPSDQVAHQSGARRAVVPDADEGGGRQPGRAWRASCSAFQCRPFLRGTCWSK